MTYSLYKKTTMAITYALFICTIAMLSILPISVINGETTTIDIFVYSFGIALSILMAVGLFLMVNSGDYNSTVELNAKGVIFSSKKKKVHITWENIRMVGFWKGSFINSYIIFSTQANTSSLDRGLGPKVISDQFIYVQYQKGMIKTLRLYWDHEIVDERRYSKE